jgi:dTDP-4-amino-4,6-dideoxygalactose transaminase
MDNRLAILGGAPARRADDIPWPVAGAEEKDALARVVDSGAWGIGGAEVPRFEATFAALHGARHGVCVTSGTVALRLALLAAGVRAGDEVLIPAYTFQATASAVVEVNAVPVCVDVDEDTRTMDPGDVERAISERTRFLMPVHVSGLPADMDGLLDVARAHGLTVIEDAAQAHGARHRLGGVGTMGAAGCFSFQSSKNLSGGEGGMVVTNDDAMADRLRALRNCGRFPDSAASERLPAGNYRMTEFQAAVLSCGLARLPDQMARRDAAAARLAGRLADVPGINPIVPPGYVSRCAWHLFMFRYDPAVYGVPRDIYLRALDAEGVAASAGYTTPVGVLSLMRDDARGPFSASIGRRRSCPSAERLCSSEGAWLYQKLLLGSTSDVDGIANAFEKVYALRAQLAEVTS